MVSFLKDEILSSTVVSRSFSAILNKLKTKRLEKIGVIRNNEMEAIILPIREYELLIELLERDEYRNIYETVKERERTPLADYVEFDSVAEGSNGSYGGV